LGRAALASLAALARAVAEVREVPCGNGVTIATTSSFAARWLLPRLAGFTAACPWIELSVVAEQRTADPAAQGADLAIRMGRGPWTGLRSEPLMDDVLYPVMSRGYWQKAGRPRTPAALARLRLLHDRDPEASWEAWRRAHPSGKLDVRAGPRFASSDLVLKAASQGLGVALARGRLAADDIAAGTLMRVCGDLQVELPRRLLDRAGSDGTPPRCRDRHDRVAEGAGERRGPADQPWQKSAARGRLTLSQHLTGLWVTSHFLTASHQVYSCGPSLCDFSTIN
jgi:LysR family glycine cleavage system transcriptional activator